MRALRWDAALTDGDLHDLVEGGGMGFFAAPHRPGKAPEMHPSFFVSLIAGFGATAAGVVHDLWRVLADKTATGYAVLIDEDDEDGECLRRLARCERRKWRKLWPRIRGLFEFKGGMASLKAFAGVRLKAVYNSAHGDYAQTGKQIRAEARIVADLIAQGAPEAMLNEWQERFVALMDRCRAYHRVREEAFARYYVFLGRVYAPKPFDDNLTELEREVRLRIDAVARRAGLPKTSRDVAPEVRRALERRRIARGKLGYLDLMAALVLTPRFFIERWAVRWGTGPPA